MVSVVVSRECNPRAWGPVCTWHLAEVVVHRSNRRGSRGHRMESGWDGALKRQVLRRADDFVSRFGAGQKLESIRGE